MKDDTSFAYETAFARNLGLVSPEEQARLRDARIALPGLGGVGGAHLQTLARMGIGSFHLADPDRFECANTQRQLGACAATFGRNKAEVMADQARQINPQAELKVFPAGLTTGNLDAFLKGVDVVVDGIEFFRIETRRMLYAACRRKRIPVVNAGPIGYGAALLVFMPEDPSFDEYFRFAPEATRAEQLLSFLLNLNPGATADIDPRYVDFEKEKGPALASACLLCAGLASTEVLKLLTRRGDPARVGRGIYLDPFRGRVIPLKRLPSLTRSLRGRLIRWRAFRSLDGLRRAHERETRARRWAPESATRRPATPGAVNGMPAS